METQAPASRCASQVRAIILVGFMGAGKTSVGRVLGRQLGWLFEDLDDRVQAREGRSIEAIFRDSGEAAFRQAETAALKELLGRLSASPQIVALGGGAFVQPENASLLASSGVTTVFLDGEPEELFRRCQEQNLDRPLRKDPQHFRQLYAVRRPQYLKAALRIQTTGKSVEAIAAEIVRAVEPACNPRNAEDI